ncbi:Lar family restriction alleviation protein [Mailhella massiliensis]|uniref:Restriction alleviation protein, Lar family n=1 Tax=Mailhella massiliensis TaxID=1903261 RepID=A0A921AVS7_9BACT|nr:Lar family restriction alleviation protein [Mailhella massiliensis]HJD97257.1 hypothetical protein [Mailhella massiliensis]
MMMHACPYCSSEDIGLIDILGRIYSVGCRNCGMTGPQAESADEAEHAWNGLCLKICSHCISRPWGRAMAKRVQAMSEEAEHRQA